MVQQGAGMYLERGLLLEQGPARGASDGRGRCCEGGSASYRLVAASPVARTARRGFLRQTFEE